MSLQPNELLIIALVALIALGPSRLPGAIRSIGRAFGQLRNYSASVRQEFDATISPPTVERPHNPSGPADPRPDSPEPASPEPATSDQAERSRQPDPDSDGAE